MQTKAEIRKMIRSQRQQLSLTTQHQAADHLCHLLSTAEFFIRAQHIAFYYAHHGELSVLTLLEKALAQHKHCYLPILDPVKENHLEFCLYHPGDQLIANKYGIPEPVYEKNKLIAAAKLDLVFTPLVAFDQYGNRLGMGAGYYDRSFAFINSNALHKPLLVGIAYEFQQLASLPSDDWDIPLHAIATEKTIYWSI